MTTEKQKSNLWAWIIVAVIVAVLAVASLYYIGWLDFNSHFDTPAGDNVEHQYQLTSPDADSPGESDWQNADHKTLGELVTGSENEAETSSSSD